VALESTIIAHGMPWPQNVETALAVEAEVRALGAVPATVARDRRPAEGRAVG
jgi:pseudouridine-5'-phosphate glycosidase